MTTISAQVLELAEEHVRTAAGEEWFHLPIGSLIVRHTHAELLAIRKAMQAKYPRSDPRVRKIRKAVVKSRESKLSPGPSSTGERAVTDAEGDTVGTVNMKDKAVRDALKADAEARKAYRSESLLPKEVSSLGRQAAKLK